MDKGGLADEVSETDVFAMWKLVHGFQNYGGVEYDVRGKLVDCAELGLAYTRNEIREFGVGLGR